VRVNLCKLIELAHLFVTSGLMSLLLPTERVVSVVWQLGLVQPLLEVSDRKVFVTSLALVVEGRLVLQRGTDANLSVELLPHSAVDLIQILLLKRLL
jgi:hypothetical protein